MDFIRVFTDDAGSADDSDAWLFVRHRQEAHGLETLGANGIRTLAP